MRIWVVLIGVVVIGVVLDVLNRFKGRLPKWKLNWIRFGSLSVLILGILYFGGVLNPFQQYFIASTELGFVTIDGMRIGSYLIDLEGVPLNGGQMTTSFEDLRITVDSRSIITRIWVERKGVSFGQLPFQTLSDAVEMLGANYFETSLDELEDGMRSYTWVDRSDRVRLSVFFSEFDRDSILWVRLEKM